MSDRRLNGAVNVVDVPAHSPASVARTATAIKYIVAIGGGLFLGLVVGVIIAISNNLVMLC